MIDFSEDLVVFRKLSDRKVIALERSTTGHQLLPMTQDWYENALPTKEAVPSLREYLGLGQLLSGLETGQEGKVEKSFSSQPASSATEIETVDVVVGGICSDSSVGKNVPVGVHRELGSLQPATLPHEHVSDTVLRISAIFQNEDLRSVKPPSSLVAHASTNQGPASGGACPVGRGGTSTVDDHGDSAGRRRLLFRSI